MTKLNIMEQKLREIFDKHNQGWGMIDIDAAIKDILHLFNEHGNNKPVKYKIVSSAGYSINIQSKKTAEEILKHLNNSGKNPPYKLQETHE